MKMIALLASTALVCGPARAFADLNFDATTVAPDTGFEVLPPGWYNFKIDESEMKPTKDGAGSYLKLRFEVLDGQYVGRKVYTNLNLRNSNVQTVEIAQKQLSAICHAVGVLRPGKSEELHGIPLKAKLKVRKGGGDYEDQNDFTAYKNINEQVDLAGGTPAGEVTSPFGGAVEGAPAQPWTNGAAAGLAGDKPADPPAQPWSPPAAETPAVPAAPVVPEAPAVPAAPAPVHDPIAAAVADGWIQHPSSPTHHYRGQEVVETEQLAGKYPAPAAPTAPVVPAAPAAPAIPAAPAAGTGAPSDAQAAAPPWATPKA